MGKRKMTPRAKSDPVMTERIRLFRGLTGASLAHRKIVSPAPGFKSSYLGLPR
jgi:hypothetical protein